jgi:hypothetical protein
VITGANSQSYRLTSADVGYTIRVVEWASNAGGTGAPATSAPTAVVAGIPARATPPVIVSTPVVTGSPIVGLPLSTTNGQWAGNLPEFYTYQWQRCQQTCIDIPSANASTYTPTSADLGSSVRTAVTGWITGAQTTADSNDVGPFLVTEAELTTMAREIAPSGATSASLLRHGRGFVTLTPGTAGLVRIYWYASRPRWLHSRTRWALLARGAALATSGAARRIGLALTPIGRELLAKRRPLKLVAHLLFELPNGTTLQVNRRFTINR